MILSLAKIRYLWQLLSCGCEQVVRILIKGLRALLSINTRPQLTDQEQFRSSNRPINPKGTNLHDKYLTSAEAEQIRKQFQAADNGRRLVFWTNIPRGLAQAWADANGCNTLTTMMGKLMDEVHLSKTGEQWSQYVKGVSCLFAELARSKPCVLILTTSPGVPRFRKESTFLSLEEPILKSQRGGQEHTQINYVHPTVQGAEVIEYSRWPEDRTSLWITRFGKQPQTEALVLWKQVRKGKAGPHFSLARLPSLQPESSKEEDRSIAKLKQDNCLGGTITHNGHSRLITRISFRELPTKLAGIANNLGNWKARFAGDCTWFDYSPEYFSFPETIESIRNHNDAVPSANKNDLCHEKVLSSSTSNETVKQVPHRVDLTVLRPPDNIVGIPPATEADLKHVFVYQHKKELREKLAKFYTILMKDSTRKGIPVIHKRHKIDSKYKVILTYGQRTFSGLSTNKQLATKLAAKQACDHLRIA